MHRNYTYILSNFVVNPPPKNIHISSKNIHFSEARGQNLGHLISFLESFGFEQQWRVQQCERLRPHFNDGTYEG